MVQTSCVFHQNFCQEYIDRIFATARTKEMISADDEQLIREYLAERQVVRGISPQRAQVNAFLLCHWRKYVHHEWRGVTIGEVYQAIQALKDGKNARGKPYAQNTLRDFVKELKPLLFWLVENGHASMELEKIRKIQTPQKNWRTTPAHDLLSEEDVRALLAGCSNSRDRALIAILFEGGPRIGELARLHWADVEVEDEYIGITFLDSKTRRNRYVCVTWGREYIVRWKNDYPFDPDEPGAYVFVNNRLEPYAYSALRKVLSTIQKKSGVTKAIHPHLFRKSRITDMVRKGFQDSIIKEAMWGNQNTNMLETYVVLAQDDIRAEFLDKAGVRKKPHVEEPILQAHQCPHCYAVLPPTDRYCGRCGTSLTPTAENDIAYAKIKLWADFEALMELAKEIEEKKQKNE